jgi:hypothetical protein
LDEIFFSALNEYRFHSLQSPSRTIKRQVSFIRDHLARAGFVLKDLQRVILTLSAEHKKARVELASQKLQHLSPARH